MAEPFAIQKSDTTSVRGVVGLPARRQAARRPRAAHERREGPPADWPSTCAGPLGIGLASVSEPPGARCHSILLPYSCHTSSTLLPYFFHTGNWARLRLGIGLASVWELGPPPSRSPLEPGAIPSVEGVWKECGRSVEGVWKEYGRSVEEVWKKCCRSMGKVWKKYGMAPGSRGLRDGGEPDSQRSSAGAWPVSGRSLPSFVCSAGSPCGLSSSGQADNSAYASGVTFLNCKRLRH
eukprot:gene15077-biopygen4086